jgi:hypothetical protein
MHGPASSLFEHWHEFYVLAGTAAAALVALMFVAVSIAAGFLGAQRASGRTAGIRTYVSPVIFHFTAVLFVSLITLVPNHVRASLVATIGAIMLVGSGYAAIVVLRVMGHHKADWPDRLCYGLVPFASYLAGIVAAILIGIDAELGVDVLAGVTIALLTVNIRNAWDLMLSFARRSAEESRAADDTG